MIVLALDTALAATSAAVLKDGAVLASQSHPMERGHAERVGGVVRDVVAASGVAFSGVDRIAVTIGPGSFTGLRVGLAFAKGLAVALDIPCVGVGTLEALAASTGVPGRIAAVIDARRGQIYVQTFEGGTALTPPAALTIEMAADRVDAMDRLVGSGAPLLPPPQNAAVDPRVFADPAAIARLAARAAEPLQYPEPLYLRAPDAKTIVERAAG